jgi:nucleoside-diphosphate-sugar epimerase
MGLVAILGATSQLAKDLIMTLAKDPMAEAVLFARRPQEVERWLMNGGFGGRFPTFDFPAFGGHTYSAIINFVGVGDPARMAQMGGEIFDVTLRFDQLALDYVLGRPACRYLFLSSGAVYGGKFDRPADELTPSCLAINAPSVHDYYAAAKLHAECRHRSLTHLPIIDIRVFSYFSRNFVLSSRFFLADILRSILAHRALETTDQPMTRDFLHPRDFAALVKCLLASPPVNAAVDCYSLAPVTKDEILMEMQRRFQIECTRVPPSSSASPSSSRSHYYSLSRKAAEFGYRPKFSSMQCIIEEMKYILY